MVCILFKTVLFTNIAVSFSEDLQRGVSDTTFKGHDVSKASSLVPPYINSIEKHCNYKWHVKLNLLSWAVH